MKRRNARSFAPVVSLLAALALAACGGSDPAPAAAISVGAVAAGPGLSVNGTTYSTAEATVVVNGAAASSVDLAPGQIAHVTHVGGEASAVRVDAILTGRVGQITFSSLTFEVRGQLVAADDATVIVDADGGAASFGDIPAGGRFRVYGIPDASGTIRATRIEIRPGTAEQLEVKGYVSSLDAVAKTFTLKVIPSSATSFAVSLADGVVLPAGLADGAYVEVRSDVAPPGAENSILASSVTRENPRFGTNVEAEVEGYVTSGDADEFVVLGTTVVTTAATIFENGTPGELLPGVKVEAEGSLDASGVLHARKVSFRANLRLVGVPSSVGSDTFVLLGFTVHVDAFTDTNGVTVDATNAVQVRGRLHGNGSDLVAERLVDESGETRIFLQGPISAPNAAGRTFQILGVTVDASGATFQDSRPEPEVVVSAATFFAQAPAGTVVKARGDTAGSLAGNVLTADEASIEGGR